MRNKLVNSVMPLAMVVASLSAAPALAATSTDTVQPQTCTVVPVGSKTSSTQSTQIQVYGDEVVAQFKVVGGADCSQTVTITTWQAPNGTDGKPYDQQTVYKHFTNTFKASDKVQMIATDLPKCYFQVDLVHGDKPTDANGGPMYGKLLISSLHGGTKACGGQGGGTPTPTPTETPTPTTTPTPTPTGTPQVLGDQTSTLPDTGAAAAGSVLGLSSMIGAGVMYIRARRNSNK